MPKLLTQVLLLRPQSGRVLIGMVAGFTSERWPASSWNTRPDHVGIRSHLKRTINDAVLMGSSGFDDLAAYRRFVDEIVSRFNARNSKRIDVERAELQLKWPQLAAWN